MSRGGKIRIIGLWYAPLEEKGYALKSILFPLSFMKSAWTNVAELVDDRDHHQTYAT